MFTEAVIQQLKQTNISVDVEKTKQRTSEVWKAANKADQGKILALAGVARSTIQRAYYTGSISAKLVVPMAQTLNVNPYYLTGEADKRGKCTDALLNELLKAHNYDDLLENQSGEEQNDVDSSDDNKVTEEEIAVRFDKEMREALQAEAEKINSEQTAPAILTLDPETQSFIDAMTEDEMILLLKAIMLRAKAGGKNADLAMHLKLLLLS